MDETAYSRLQPFDAKQHCRLAQRPDSADDESLVIVEARFATGDRVRVFCGLFAGAEGTVLDRCGESRLVIGLELEQQGVSLEINDASLEPID